MQKVLQRLGISKTQINPIYPQSDGMVERCVKSVEHLQKVVSRH
jgi:hypothetical protein